MSDPTREQPSVSPQVTTRSPWHISRIPAHLGRARTSTVVLSALFVAIFALHLYVKPNTPATTTSGTTVPAPVVTTTPAPRRTPAPVPTTTPTRVQPPASSAAPTTTEAPTSASSTLQPSSPPSSVPTTTPPSLPTPTVSSPAG